MSLLERIQQTAVLISGEPGSGNTTDAAKLCDILENEYPHIKSEKLRSGGHLRRALALHWFEFCTEMGITAGDNLNEIEGSQLAARKQRRWQEFAELYLRHRQDPQRAIQVLQPYLDREAEFSEKVLQAFNQDSEKYVGDEVFWVHLPEIYLLLLLNKSEADVVVWESKNATVIKELIDVLAREYPSIAQAIQIDKFALVRIALEVSDYTSAYRVAKREIEKDKLSLEISTEPASEENLPIFNKKELLEWWGAQDTEDADITAGFPQSFTKRGKTGSLFPATLRRWKTAVIEGYKKKNRQRMEEDAQRYAKAYNLPAEVFTPEFRATHPDADSVTRIETDNKTPEKICRIILRAMGLK